MSNRSSASAVLGSFLERGDRHRCLALTSGLAAFDSRRWMIRHARSNIWISTFLWRNDRLGNFLLDELLARAQSGLEVRVLLDHWGVMVSKDSILPRFRDLAECEKASVRLFNPVTEKCHPDEAEVIWSGFRQAEKLNHRMHGKLALFDGAAGVVGGRNIGDEYFDLHRFRCFSDAELLINGPAVEPMRNAFDAFWNSSVAVDLASFDFDAHSIQWEDPRQGDTEQWNMFLQTADQCCPDYTGRVFEPEAIEVVTDDPEVARQRPELTADATIRFLTGGTRTLRITSPILIFPDQWLGLLKNRRQQFPGLEFSLVTNSLVSTDNLYTYAAGLRQRKELIGSLAARLHEIQPVPKEIDHFIPSYSRLQKENAELDEQPRSGFGSNRFEFPELHTTLHAKYAVADEERLLLGSPNLDPRSLFFNTEIVLLIRGSDISQYFADLHDRFRKNRNSWIVASPEVRHGPGWLSRLRLAWHHSTVKRRWPYRNGSCFMPREEVPDEVPDPDAADFQDRYRSCGVYPGVNDSERKIEMVFLENVSTIFRQLL